MPYLHRVDRKREPKPPLPKEVVELAPRTYRDRWGTVYEVVWNGHRQDRPLSLVAPTLWKGTL